MMRLRPQSIGQLLDAAVTLTVRHWRPLLTVGALTVVAQELGFYWLDRVVLPPLRAIPQALTHTTVGALEGYAETFAVEELKALIWTLGFVVIAILVDDSREGLRLNTISAAREVLSELGAVAEIFLIYIAPVAALFGLLVEVLFWPGPYQAFWNRNFQAAYLFARIPAAYVTVAGYVALAHVLLRADGRNHRNYGLIALRSVRRTLLAALAIVGLQEIASVVLPFFMRMLSVFGYRYIIVHDIVRTILFAFGAVFVTLFYLDLCRRASENDLEYAGRILEQEARVPV
jgi:hypothetical protein